MKVRLPLIGALVRMAGVSGARGIGISMLLVLGGFLMVSPCRAPGGLHADPGGGR
jgi:hypothetical protein